ncbi:DUF2726 domain-containing protein [Providencia alcalifaciens]|uniref:DUF2726 domain-containing protein n=1 Tax=Providencia alcalifaciens TaxID=126385 RepID=UPI0032DA319F
MKITVLVLYFLLALVLIYNYLSKRKNKFNDNNKLISGFVVKKPLTKSELIAYSKIEKLLGDDEILLSQVRLADILKVDNNKYKYKSSDWYVRFNKIKSKHCDFVVVNKISGEVVIVIELDDHTHRADDRINRDIEVNHIFGFAGVNLLRTDLKGLDHLKKLSKE